MTVPGKPGLDQVEIVLVAGLAAGEGDGFGGAGEPLAKTRMPCGTRMCSSAVKRSVM